jgi:two-component system response regulator DctR
VSAGAKFRSRVDDDVLLEAARRSLAFDVRRRSEGDKHPEIRQPVTLLTAREREVLRYVVAEMSSKEIATRLSVSFKTVEALRGVADHPASARG